MPAAQYSLRSNSPTAPAAAIDRLQIWRNLERLQQLRAPLLLLLDGGPHLVPAYITAVEAQSGHVVVRRFGPSAKQLPAALDYLALGSLQGGGEFVVAGTFRHSDDSAVLRLDFPEAAGVCEQREYPCRAAPPGGTLHLGGTAAQPQGALYRVRGISLDGVSIEWIKDMGAPAFAPGQIIGSATLHCDGEVLHFARLRVAHVSPEQHGHLIGFTVCTPTA